MDPSAIAARCRRTWRLTLLPVAFLCAPLRGGMPDEQTAADLKVCEPLAAGTETSANASKKSLSRDELREILGDAKRLAAVRFPLPRDEFEGEIESLVTVLAAKLRHIDELQWPNGLLDQYQATHLFDLVTPWRHPRLRESLLHVLRTKSAYRYHAAEALLEYGDPVLRREVEKYRDCKFTFWATGDACAEVFIGHLLVDPSRFAERPPLEDLEASLPAVDSFELVGRIRGFGVDTALEGLRSTNLSVRLQSWTWLARKGIFAPTAPVEEAWPLLDAPARERVVDDLRSTWYVGVDRLRTHHERLLTQRAGGLSRRALGEIISTLGWLQSDLGRQRAKAIIVRRLSGLGPSRSLFDEDRLLFSALCALRATPRVADIPCLKVLSESANREVRAHAWAGLAAIETQEAIEILRPALLEADFLEVNGAAWTLAEIGPSLQRHRWKYLDVLVEALRVRHPERQYGCLIHAFAAVAGRDFEFHSPGPGTVDPSPKLIRRCLDWHRKNRPPR